MAYRTEFVGWAAISGDSSGGAIVRLSDGDERVLSAVVRFSRTVMTTSGLTDERLAEILSGLTADLVRRKAEVDPSWVQQHRSETDVPIIVTDAKCARARAEG